MILINNPAFLPNLTVCEKSRIGFSGLLECARFISMGNIFRVNSFFHLANFRILLTVFLTFDKQARFLISLRRILSPSGVLYSEDLESFRLAELKAA